MALGNLGDLDEYMKMSNSTTDEEFPAAANVLNSRKPDGTIRPDSATLYTQAIRSSRVHYEDRHVYPYTFQGGYYHRHKMYKEAFHAWACAGDVIRQLVILIIYNKVQSTKTPVSHLRLKLLDKNARSRHEPSMYLWDLIEVANIAITSITSNKLKICIICIEQLLDHKFRYV